MNRPRRRNGPARDWQEIRDRLARAAADGGAESALDPRQAEALLEERARALARVPALPPPASEVLDLVTFTLGTEDYAIEMAYVRKVVRWTETTPVPGTPDHLVGLINLRGEILAVFDLRRLYGMPATAATDRSRVLVLGGGDRNELGLVADAVNEVIVLRTGELLELQGSGTGPGRQHLRGVTRSALIVLDGAVLLQDDCLVINQGEDAGA